MSKKTKADQPEDSSKAELKQVVDLNYYNTIALENIATSLQSIKDLLEKEFADED